MTALTEFRIEPAGPNDEAAVERLCRGALARPPARKLGWGRLVARTAAGEVVGVAEYTRTFPPEDGAFYLVVAEHYRRLGIGKQLLQGIAWMALRDGIRSLWGIINWHDKASRKLLESAGIPVFAYRGDVFAWVELDLVPLLREYGRGTVRPERRIVEYVEFPSRLPGR